MRPNQGRQPYGSITVVVGNGCCPEQVRRASNIALRRNPESLYLAVLATDSATDEQAAVAHISASFDAVVVALPGDVAAAASAVIEAILAPVAAEHPWCFDWNDMREICCSVASEREPARVYIDTMRGQDAGPRFAANWLKRRDSSGPRKLLILISVPAIDQLQQHHRILRTLADAGATVGVVGSGVAVDRALASDEVALTIVDFGSAPESKTSAWIARTDLVDSLDLPAFLRHA